MMVKGATRATVALADPEQFRVFYANALPRVYGYHFLRCGADLQVAEDLTQETFLAAVLEIKRGRLITNPLPWIIGIARHKLMDHYRRQQRSSWKLLSWDEDVVDEVMVTPDFDDMFADRAIAALSAVSSPQREALVLRYMDGCSVPEVAAHLGRSVEAAESLLSRGRAGFRRAYLEVGDGN